VRKWRANAVEQKRKKQKNQRRENKPQITN